VRIDCGDFEIRSYRSGDVTALARRANNPRIAEHLRDRFPFPYTVADAREWLSVALSQDPETHFVIAVDGELAGTIGLQLGEDVYHLSAEIGYWLAEEYWHRGFATAAVGALTDWGFSTLGLLRVHAYVFDTNRASMRVLEKAGFELEGRMRHAVFKNGRLLDQLIYAKLAPIDDDSKGSGGR
jgi:RimJ/RimL family protein N-acetyltransferase